MSNHDCVADLRTTALPDSPVGRLLRVYPDRRTEADPNWIRQFDRLEAIRDLRADLER